MTTDLALLLHGSGIDDVIVIGAAIYITVMFIISRLKIARQKKARARRKLAKAQKEAQADKPDQTEPLP